MCRFKFKLILLFYCYHIIFNSVKASHAERAATMQRSQLETVQVLSNLDYSTWRSLVKKLQIKVRVFLTLLKKLF